ncbi:MAG: RNA polymerase sigma-70 factor [Prevotella sp.]|jgi:RNA polymerase sigma-70 factor (family 1)|nr:RNA polymerase sigma-70 factor [Prevotella sp.]
MDIDNEVILKLKKHDEDAFDYIYWKYSGRIYNFVFSLLHNKEIAEDITQETFYKIWEKAKDIDIDGNFNSYIYTISRNMIYKEIEKRLRDRKIVENIMSISYDNDNQSTDFVEKDSLNECINKIVEKLPPSRKKIYLLSRKNHLSNKKIAELLNISQRTVETQIHRSLDFIKDNLAKELTIIALSIIFK